MEASFIGTGGSLVQAEAIEIPVPGYNAIVTLNFRQGDSRFYIMMPGKTLAAMKMIAEVFNEAQRGPITEHVHRGYGGGDRVIPLHVAEVTQIDGLGGGAGGGEFPREADRPDRS